MLSTSFAFRRQLAQNTKVALRATLTLADETVHEITGDELVLGGLTVSESTTTVGGFDVGAAIAGSCELTLANHDGQFDSYDFTGSTLVLYVGAELPDGTTEWLRRGTYNVTQPDSYGSTIPLRGLDNLQLLKVPYSEVETAYPANLARIIREACAECGLSTLSDSFPYASYIVQQRPDDERLTCLDVVGYAAQAAGCFVRCDPFGRVRVAWYDTSAFESEDWLDGGTHDTDTTPYSDGDAADGGSFMSGGDAADGGSFDEGPWAHLHAITSLTTSTDDVVITGIRATAAQEVNEDGTLGDEGESYLYGTEGYVLALESNPLIEFGRAAEVAENVANQAVGMRFRPYDAMGIASPAWEAGDPIIITDARQRTYRSWITNYTWKAGGYASLACRAETPARNSAASASAATRAMVEARNAIRAERSARELALQVLAEELATSSGLYVTADVQQDGSTIYYAHDKATLAESQIVWKFTATALGISTDGGVTFPYGLDVSGTAILERVYAIGLDADYLNVGRIQAQVGSNFWDLVTGEFQLASTATIGGRTVGDVLDDVDATITGVMVEYAQNQSPTTAPTSGWSTSHPTWQSGYYIWQRVGTTDADGTTYSDPVMISGKDGSDGQAATTYEATASSNCIVRKDAGGTTPPIVAFYGYSTTGNGDRQAYAGRFEVQTGVVNGSTGQITWSTVYTSSANETYYSYSVPSNLASNVGHIRCNLYKAGGTTTLLDRVTVPVIGDGRGVSSAEVRYGVSNSASTQPTTWLTTAPTTIATGKWLWTRTYTTYSDGSYSTAYSKSYVGTNGTDGADGTSVTILGSYNTLADLQAAHPTGSLGDSYIVAGDLYVWSGSAWTNVGQIQGPAGADGADGTSVTVSAIEYATSDGTTPSASDWSQSMPATIAQGEWLWVRTTYSDGSSATTKTYMGTDGEDGSSVYVRSATKSGGVTTVILKDTSDGSETTLTIADGEDGSDGTPGAGGYVHTAWANSANGQTDFSTTVSANKKYLGVYTDNTLADSSNPSDYSWSLIKGSDGSDAYTVLLTNESHTFAGGTSAAVAGSTTSAIIAYKGTTRVAATIGTITGAPTGMTVTKTSNGTTSASITVSVTTSLTTRQGVLTIPVTVDGKSFTLTFSWSLALKGEKGATGDNGVGLSGYVDQYYLSTSSSTQVGGSWSATQPTWQAGRYIWERTRLDWDDGTTTYTTPILAQALTQANKQAKDASDAVSSLDSELDSEGVFNRLTNNGQTQGIYMSGGKIYLNATYINTGSLNASLIKTGTLDADLIGTGTLLVQKSGRAVFEADVDAGTVTIDANNFKLASNGNITSTGGTIGGFTITSSSLYNGKSSLSSLTSGVYISTSGISVGSGSAYTALASGYLYGGGSSGNTHGYVGFNNYWESSGIYGARLAGRGCIALLTNGPFGIGSYYNFGSNATITTGASGSQKFIVDIRDIGGGAIEWTWKYLTFTKGLMTTSLSGSSNVIEL